MVRWIKKPQFRLYIQKRMRCYPETDQEISKKGDKL
jgi:hypothetical protein